MKIFSKIFLTFGFMFYLQSMCSETPVKPNQQVQQPAQPAKPQRKVLTQVAKPLCAKKLFASAPANEDDLSLTMSEEEQAAESAALQRIRKPQDPVDKNPLASKNPFQMTQEQMDAIIAHIDRPQFNPIAPPKAVVLKSKVKGPQSTKLRAPAVKGTKPQVPLFSASNKPTA